MPCRHEGDVSRGAALPLERKAGAVNCSDQVPPAALPPGWQRMLTADGREYFVDHNTQTTSWTRPTF